MRSQRNLSNDGSRRFRTQNSMESPSAASMYALGAFDSSGVTLTESGFRARNKQQGLCEQCGKVKTHNRGTMWSSQPITKEPQVYTGYCLECHSIEDVVAYPNVIKSEQKKSGRRPGWVKDLLLTIALQKERTRLIGNSQERSRLMERNRKLTSHRTGSSESCLKTEETPGDVDRKKRFIRLASLPPPASLPIDSENNRSESENESHKKGVNRPQSFRKQEHDDNAENIKFGDEKNKLRRRLTECDEEDDDSDDDGDGDNKDDDVLVCKTENSQRRNSLSRQESQKSVDSHNSSGSIDTFGSEKSDGSLPQSNNAGSRLNLPQLITQIKSEVENDTASIKNVIKLSIAVYSHQNDVSEDELENNLTDFLIAILEATQRHGDDLEITILAFEALMAMTTYKPFEGGDVMPSPEACSLVAILPGGIDHIVCSMGKHVASLDLQMNGLKLLRNIVQSTVEAKPQIVEADTDQGINRIIQTMFEHSGSAEIQEYGCVLLWSLSYDDTETQIRIDEAFGVGAIISGMNAHSSYVPLQEQALGALHTLALDEDTRENILRNGGTTSIVKAMQTHPNIDTIQEKATTALVTLVLNTDQQLLSDTIPGIDVVEAIIEAMKNHPKNVEMLETSCHVIYLLTKYDDNVVEALKKNKVAVINTLRHAASIVIEMSRLAEQLIELIRS